jgi:hypothetical protein
MNPLERFLSAHKDPALWQRVFESFIVKVIRCETGCWLWHGAIKSTGYGVLWVDGKTHSAHQISFMLFKGPILGHLCVLHSCDNRTCVNPDHLFLGTYKDNYDDAYEKGRLHFQKVSKNSERPPNIQPTADKSPTSE